MRLKIATIGSLWQIRRICCCWSLFLTLLTSQGWKYCPDCRKFEIMSVICQQLMSRSCWSFQECHTVIPINESIVHVQLGLTVSLVSQFFSREFCRKWDSLLAKISVQVSWVSRVSQEVKNAIYCQACESRNLWVSHLQDSQTSKVITHNEKLVLG
jgi:hypothetical protein